MDFETLKERLNRDDRFCRANGIHLTVIRPGYAEAELEITPDKLNGLDLVQGGAIFTLADLAFAAATNSHAQLTLSITSNINFFRAESKGFLYAEAREVLNKKRLANCEVNITNEAGNLVATFNGTGYRKEQTLPFAPIEDAQRR